LYEELLSHHQKTVAVHAYYFTFHIKIVLRQSPQKVLWSLPLEHSTAVQFVGFASRMALKKGLKWGVYVE
jgi:hypothetical protein